MDTQSEIEAVLTELEPFLRIVWEAIEGGAAHARWYVEQRQRLDPKYQPEATVANDLTRSWAKAYMKEKAGLEVEDFEQPEVANIGLRARIASYDIRIWKSPDHRIPYPGTSRRKRRFIEQAIQARMIFPDCPEPANFAILWNVDRDHKPRSLFLAKPKYAPDSIFEDVGTYWTEEIAHPAMTLPATEPSPEQELPAVEYEVLSDDEARESEEG